MQSMECNDDYQLHRYVIEDAGILGFVDKCNYTCSRCRVTWHGMTKGVMILMRLGIKSSLTRWLVQSGRCAQRRVNHRLLFEIVN